jgi:mono/diheme cytochrome c family protein
MTTGSLRPALGALAFTGMLGFGAASHAQNLLLQPDDPAIVAQGQEIYQSTCAACHGDKLQGQDDWQTRDENGYMPAPPHNVQGHTWHHAETQLFLITKVGVEQLVGGNYKTNMIGYGDVLTDDEIIAVLSYIKSTWPEPARKRNDAVTRAAIGQ